MKNVLRALRTLLAFTISISSFVAIGWGVREAMTSPLFTVQVVEVLSDNPDRSPVDAQTISELAEVPVGNANLFTLDLDTIEERVLRNFWVREVQLTKRFPQTLEIKVEFHQPVAISQGNRGNLSYVDRDGKIFGAVDLKQDSDLPLLTGMSQLPRARIQGALKIVEAWGRVGLPIGPTAPAQIASVSWDSERGYRALIVHSGGRTQVQLGQYFDDSLDSRLSRLHEVLRYVNRHKLAVRQISADIDKKIVVKTAIGS